MNLAAGTLWLSDARLDNAALVELAVRSGGITDCVVDEVRGEKFIHDGEIALVPDILVKAAKHGLVLCLDHRVTMIASGYLTSENPLRAKFGEFHFHALG